MEALRVREQSVTGGGTYNGRVGVRTVRLTGMAV